jgi:hypothetical protein
MVTLKCREMAEEVSLAVSRKKIFGVKETVHTYTRAV